MHRAARARSSIIHLDLSPPRGVGASKLKNELTSSAFISWLAVLVAPVSVGDLALEGRPHAKRPALSLAPTLPAALVGNENNTRTKSGGRLAL